MDEAGYLSAMRSEQARARQFAFEAARDKIRHDTMMAIINKIS